MSLCVVGTVAVRTAETARATRMLRASMLDGALPRAAPRPAAMPWLQQKRRPGDAISLTFAI